LRAVRSGLGFDQGRIGSFARHDVEAPYLVHDLAACPITGTLALDVVRFSSSVDLVGVEPTILTRWLEIDAVLPTPVPTAIAACEPPTTTTPVDSGNWVSVHSRKPVWMNVYAINAATTMSACLQSIIDRTLTLPR
jgi:hypothetical protein